MCTKQDQEREQGIQLPVSHTLSDHRICHGVSRLGVMSRMEVYLHGQDSIIEVFYHLSNMFNRNDAISELLHFIR